MPSDRDGLLMHKYYRGDLYETANIYCNRIRRKQRLKGRHPFSRKWSNTYNPVQKILPVCDGCFENDVAVLPLRQNTVQEVVP